MVDFIKYDDEHYQMQIDELPEEFRMIALSFLIKNYSLKEALMEALAWQEVLTMTDNWSLNERNRLLNLNFLPVQILAALRLGRIDPSEINNKIDIVVEELSRRVDSISVD